MIKLYGEPTYVMRNKVIRSGKEKVGTTLKRAEGNHDLQVLKATVRRTIGKTSASSLIPWGSMTTPMLHPADGHCQRAQGISYALRLHELPQLSERCRRYDQRRRS